MSIIFALHTVSTLAMFGLIWFVQVVHYPLFHRVGRDAFVTYEAIHQRRTTWIVAPFMCIEAITAVALVLLVDDGGLWLVALLGLLLLITIWMSTAFLQVPCHRILAANYDSSTAQKLVATNWIRTIAWTARAGIAVFLMS